MQMSWVLATEKDGVFPSIDSHVKAMNHGGQVYRLQAGNNVSSEMAFLQRKGFKVVENKEKMGLGSVYYELDNHYSGEGSLYAYAADLSSKLGAVPGYFEKSRPSPQRASGVSNPSPDYYSIS